MGRPAGWSRRSLCDRHETQRRSGAVSLRDFVLPRPAENRFSREQIGRRVVEEVALRPSRDPRPQMFLAGGSCQRSPLRSNTCSTRIATAPATAADLDRAREQLAAARRRADTEAEQIALIASLERLKGAIAAAQARVTDSLARRPHRPRGGARGARRQALPGPRRRDRPGPAQQPPPRRARPGSGPRAGPRDAPHPRPAHPRRDQRVARHPRGARDRRALPRAPRAGRRRARRPARRPGRPRGSGQGTRHRLPARPRLRDPPHPRGEVRPPRQPPTRTRHDELPDRVPARRAGRRLPRRPPAGRRHRARADRRDARSRGQVMADTLVERLTGQAAGVRRRRRGPRRDDRQHAAHRRPLARRGRRLRPDPRRAGPRHRPRRAAGLAAPSLHPPGTGDLVATDSRRRAFAGELRELLVVRDQVCRTPWCDAPVRHADHVVAAADGGETSVGNGQGLCEACNYAKEAPGWRTMPLPGDRHQVLVTTPTGHTHVSTAPDPPGSVRRPRTRQRRRDARLHPGSTPGAGAATWCSCDAVRAWSDDVADALPLSVRPSSAPRTRAGPG